MEGKRLLVVGEMKVYGKGRTQIPTKVTRDLGVKDGDRIRWIEWAPGSYLIEAVRVVKFRSMAVG